MKRKIALGVLLFLFSLKTFSQSPNWHWAKGMGGTSYDIGYSIALDASGNVYTTGNYRGSVDFDPGPATFYLFQAGVGYEVFISKLDASGNFVWAKALGGTGATDEGYSIALDASGNVYTSGWFGQTVDFDPGAGVFNLNSGLGEDIFISKLDSSGNFIWAKAMGGTNGCNARSYSIALDASGNVYATGWFSGPGTVDFDPGAGVFNLTSLGSDIFISKLDSSGNFVWAKAMGGGGSGIGRSITLDASGNVYTTGSFGGTADFDPGAGVFNLTADSTDIFISKLDGSGNFVWAKSMGGTVHDNGFSIAIDHAGSGDVYTTGSFLGTVDFDPGAGAFNLTSSGIGDIFISKLDSSGNFVWAKRMGGTSVDDGYSIAIDPAGSGDIYTTGNFHGTVDFDPGVGVFNLTSSGLEDIFISKLDVAGNFIWAKATGGTSNDIGYSITLNASGNVYVTGYFFSPFIAFDSTTVTNAVASTTDIFIAKLDTIIITGNNEAEKLSNAIFIFPNPSTSEVTINFSKEGWYDVHLCNTLGETLFETTTSAEQMKIDVKDFPKGIYFVSVRDEDNNLVVKKIVKM